MNYLNVEQSRELIPPFWQFSNFTPTIPKLYWDVKSQEQRILNLFQLLDKLVNYDDELAKELNLTKEEIEKLKETINELFNEDSDFWKLFKAQLQKWVENNMPSLIEQNLKNVYFGLTDDGYFTAYVPESWSDITFDTGAEYGAYTYGRLILRYNVDGSGVIDNVNYGSYDKLAKAIEILNKTVYTPVSESEV